MTAVAPASATTCKPSGKGKKASDAATEPCVSGAFAPASFAACAPFPATDSKQTPVSFSLNRPVRVAADASVPAALALAATQGSARALGFGDRVGRIGRGYKADLVMLDLDHPNWLPLNDPVNQLVHSEDGNAVLTIRRAPAGRLIVSASLRNTTLPAQTPGAPVLLDLTLDGGSFIGRGEQLFRSSGSGRKVKPA